MTHDHKSIAAQKFIDLFLSDPLDLPRCCKDSKQLIESRQRLMEEQDRLRYEEMAEEVLP